jgi:hypothetical protein
VEQAKAPEPDKFPEKAKPMEAPKPVEAPKPAEPPKVDEPPKPPVSAPVVFDRPKNAPECFGVKDMHVVGDKKCIFCMHEFHCQLAG